MVLDFVNDTYVLIEAMANLPSDRVKAGIKVELSLNVLQKLCGTSYSPESFNSQIDPKMFFSRTSFIIDVIP